MWNNIKIANKFFFKSKFNILTGLILPTVLSVLGVVIWSIHSNVSVADGSKFTVGILGPQNILPAMSTMSILCVCIFLMPTMVYEARRTDIFNRLSTAKEEPIRLCVGIAIYCAIVSVISYFFDFSLGCLIIYCTGEPSFIDSVIYMFINANYGEVVFSLIIYILLGLTVGFVIVAICKTFISILMLSLVLLILQLFIGGGILPIQFVEMITSQNPKGFDFASLTYASLFRYPAMQLMEAWTQGPIVNAGIYDWNSLLFASLSKNVDYDLAMKLGYSSIFDIHHSFITDAIPITRFNDTFGADHLDTWYLQNCIGDHAYDTSVALWSAFWMNINIPPAVQALLPVDVSSIPRFTMATPIDKILDLILPWVMIIIGWGGIMIAHFKFRKGVIYA